ncbi:type II toxin-antitoxin system HicA family toxin [Desulfobacca acetoxidans]|uniref:type II toxin-antitoxin system HicA family toxin n=1 Tax=Desulfobacca acetoxidans TaxID=60893 RepID=UPI00059C74B0|nr:type II toxin-antitoxin system HicA family toxin [Desulfobacca acetoxidans]
MNWAKLDKLRSWVKELREKGGVNSSELESLASALGRVPSDRGKHQTWINKRFPDLRPISIPRHGSKDLNKITKNSILDQLEFDLEKIEEEIVEE